METVYPVFDSNRKPMDTRRPMLPYQQNYPTQQIDYIYYVLV